MVLLRTNETDEKWLNDEERDVFDTNIKKIGAVTTEGLKTLIIIIWKNNFILIYQLLYILLIYTFIF